MVSAINEKLENFKESISYNKFDKVKEVNAFNDLKLIKISEKNCKTRPMFTLDMFYSFFQRFWQIIIIIFLIIT